MKGKADTLACAVKLVALISPINEMYEARHSEEAFELFLARIVKWVIWRNLVAPFGMENSITESVLASVGTFHWTSAAVSPEIFEKSKSGRLTKSDIESTPSHSISRLFNLLLKENLMNDW